MSPHSHPLIQRLTDEYGYPVACCGNLGQLTDEGTACLFFSGDPQRIPEACDLAVVLPELADAFEGRFAPMVVSREDERELQQRYGFRQWPALVFLRDGEYLGALERIQDWADYREALPALLDGETGRAPGIGIAVTVAPPVGNTDAVESA